jgi:hypothetical protein
MKIKILVTLLVCGCMLLHADTSVQQEKTQKQVAITVQEDVRQPSNNKKERQKNKLKAEQKKEKQRADKKKKAEKQAEKRNQQLAVKQRKQKPPRQPKHTQEFQVMFYNVENLFDTYDDPTKLDNEFLPKGQKKWTTQRYYNHLKQTAQVITAVGQWSTPALVGMCEVENDTVVTHLLTRTPLRKQNYQYRMTKGNDPRGINNVLLYQRDKFKFIGQQDVRLKFSNRRKRSRDILHVWGRIITNDTLDVFVCHFPSRAGGETASEPSRIEAATRVKQLCDSISKVRKNPNIIVMGDFNDTPVNKSMRVIGRSLNNLFAGELNHKGTYKYKGAWSQLDQMFVNRNWNEYLKPGSNQIFYQPFLLKDDRSPTKRPYRSYNGNTYEAGFSDHLPIVATFILPTKR